MSAEDIDQEQPAHHETTTVLPDLDHQSARHVFLTRAQAARRLGVSLATVRRMEGAELQPVIIDGKHCFAIDELDKHRKVTDGDLAAQAFELFNADMTQVDVVIALKEPPERIRKLFQDWTEMSDCLVASSPGIGGRKLRGMFKGQLTRRLIWVCLNIVLGNPALRLNAERALGHPIA